MTPGASLLEAFLRVNSITQMAASKALGVSDPTIHDWVSGAKRPRAHHRKAIDVWTGGSVPELAWATDDERVALAKVGPFIADDDGKANGTEG